MGYCVENSTSFIFFSSIYIRRQEQVIAGIGEGGGDILATGFRICLNLPLPITHIDRNLRKNSKREQDPEHSNNATQNKSKINCNANPFALMRIKATSTTAKIE